MKLPISASKSTQIKELNLLGHRTLVVADVHLMPSSIDGAQSNNQHPINRCFLAFLSQKASQADQLIIMGDLFEAWVGDDVSMPFYSTAIKAIASLKDKGTRVYIGLGNRDFLIGNQLLSACNAEPLFEDIVLLQHQQHAAIILMHGDSLCTDDTSYQRFRYWLRQAWLKRLFLSLPASWRFKLAQKLRNKSSQANQRKPAAIMDVNEKAIKAVFVNHPEAKHLIHGHTHQPNHHLMHLGLNVGKNECLERWVLGDWHEEGAKYITIEEGIPRCENFKPQGLK